MIVYDHSDDSLKFTANTIEALTIESTGIVTSKGQTLFAKEFGVKSELAKQAAILSKADLVSEMVMEFPELQGIMGGHYAKIKKEHEEVTKAIFEHYKPKGVSDDLPETKLGSLLSMVDKIDTLVGFCTFVLKISKICSQLSALQPVVHLCREMCPRGLQGSRNSRTKHRPRSRVVFASLAEGHLSRATTRHAAQDWPHACSQSFLLQLAGRAR